MSFQLGVSNPYNFIFLRSFYQEFSNDGDDDDDDDDDEEAEEEKAGDLHELMTADTDNIFNFMSYFC